MREAPALVLIGKIRQAGATVQVYDPIAMTECKRRIGNQVIYCKDMYEATLDADALLLVTEWKEFRMPSLTALSHSHAYHQHRKYYDHQSLLYPPWFGSMLSG